MGARHPHEHAIRCLPCGFNSSAVQLPFAMAVGCPCTTKLVCATEGGYQGVLSNDSCGAPRCASLQRSNPAVGCETRGNGRQAARLRRTPIRTYSVHGGAGVLISVGLLRNVDFEQLRRSVLESWNSGGDAFITTALWEVLLSGGHFGVSVRAWIMH